MTVTGAVADAPNLAATGDNRTKSGDGPLQIADGPRVGDTAHPLNNGAHILGVARALAVVQIRSYGDTPTGSEIPIEFRSADEVIFFNEKRIVAEGAGIKSPAFDVTPHKYIRGIVTEKGILKKPFDESIKQAFEND